ncbi:hypothetical protein CANCADRAFT_45477 [Tortispora caseinolytica NRRL Y-17796]|uniref:Cyclin N-terminal domain-containing protein n=1 Tax=Tortispora caseinolytica NRRL Y-17796 TaxID=767744 RepID=A0A1E4TB88_9ASCO|nr:hypothetical protein CANCADRAFT_45477 [Tortispora caseinolytica NRRL Y-17796]
MNTSNTITAASIIDASNNQLSLPSLETSNSSKQIILNDKPDLRRSKDKRKDLLDSLVECAALFIESLWVKNNANAPKIIPLRVFVKETLRRSRATYTVLQLALYYLLLLKPKLQRLESDCKECKTPEAMLACGRRMFLTSLVLAFKYLQDCNYTAKGWSKISGLAPSEISSNEYAFLNAVDWQLHVPHDVFDNWSSLLWDWASSSNKRDGWVDRLFKFQTDLEKSKQLSVLYFDSARCSSDLVTGIDDIPVLTPPHTPSDISSSSPDSLMSSHDSSSLCSAPVAPIKAKSTVPALQTQGLKHVSLDKITAASSPSSLLSPPSSSDELSALDLVAGKRKRRHDDLDSSLQERAAVSRRVSRIVSHNAFS